MMDDTDEDLELYGILMPLMTKEDLTVLIRRIKHVAWCEGREAAVKHIDIGGVYSEIAEDIRALKSPYAEPKE